MLHEHGAWRFIPLLLSSRKGNNSISFSLLPLPALPSQAADLSLEKSFSDACGLFTIQATDDPGYKPFFFAIQHLSAAVVNGHYKAINSSQHSN